LARRFIRIIGWPVIAIKVKRSILLLIIIHIVNVPLVRYIQVQVASNSTGFQRLKVSFCLLKVAKQGLTGIGEVRSDVVRSTPDELSLEGQPLDTRLPILSIFTDHDLCRATPANLHQISSSGISPEETKLANLKHGVVTFILPQEGTSQLQIQVHIQEGCFCGTSSSKVVLERRVPIKMLRSKLKQLTRNMWLIAQNPLRRRETGHIRGVVELGHHVPKAFLDSR